MRARRAGLSLDDTPTGGADGLMLMRRRSAGEHGGEQGGAGGEMVDEDGFLGGVGAFADSTHAVERRDAESGGKVAVGCASGRCFAELPVDLSSEGLSGAEELDGASGALHGGSVNATVEGEGAIGFRGGFKTGEALFDTHAIGGATDADVDFGPGFGGDDVGFCPAADDADVDGGAAGKVGPGADFFGLPGEFQDGGSALGKVDAGMGGASVDGETPVAGAFAGGLVGEALGGLEDVNSLALLGERFGDGARDGAADLFFAVEEEDNFAVDAARFEDEFEGGEGHGDAGFHVEGAGAVEA